MPEYDTADELQRLEALFSLEILDTPEEHEFDELVQLASEICATPISMVSLVDRERQWFKAAIGVTGRQTHRDLSFCSHAIKKPELFVVENAMADDRFRNNLLVTGEPNIRFYAGIPLHAPNGYAVGTLCVIDTVPRSLTEAQKNALTILGRQVKARMDLRLKQKSLEKAVAVNEQLLITLRDRNNLFSAFMNNGPFLSYIKGYDGRYVYYNEQLCRRFGVSADAWIGRTDHDNLPLAVADEFRKHDLGVLEGGVPVEVGETIPGDGDAVTHWRSYKFPFRRENGEFMLAGMSLDVTQEFEKERALAAAHAELERMATTDALTGLSNRRVFEERISAGFAGAARRDRAFSVMVMDIDDFKRRNDTYGHAAGDDALREMGRVLRDTIRAGELAARIGGEEFAILLPDCDGISAAPLAERIQAHLRAWNGSPMPLTASIGIACASPIVSTWERLLSSADDAMYEAKRSGKNRIVISATGQIPAAV